MGDLGGCSAVQWGSASAKCLSPESAAGFHHRKNRRHFRTGLSAAAFSPKGAWKGLLQNRDWHRNRQSGA